MLSEKFKNALAGVLFLCAVFAVAKVDTDTPPPRKPKHLYGQHLYCPPQDGLTKRAEVPAYCAERGEYMED